MSNFEELTQLVPALNQKKQEVEKVLQCVERKLVAMDLDLETWLVEDPLISQSMRIDGSTCQVEQVLGFGRHEGNYALLVKEIVRPRDDGWQFQGWLKSGLSRPLREEARELRFRAIGKLDALVSALTVHSKEMIDAFDAGRKTQKHC
ncbi:MAG: hypothetical protein IT391_10840 [Nitrospira sp.]|nr:hypothetical protein [Nitrospira sp.]